MEENRKRSQTNTEEQQQGIRLNKFISESGYCSRREADRLVEQGKVLVDGIPAVMGMKVFPGQRIEADGTLLSKEEEQILLVVNKPRGIVCTTDKRWGDKTVDDILQYPKRVFSIGRLDKDSQGLLLMTNQGDILNKILKAGNAHEKEYIVAVDHPIRKQFLKQMEEGVYLPDLEVTTRPCTVEQTGELEFRIILTQGLNRQIRRMCAALGYQVKKLERIRIMNIELGDLAIGTYRSVTEDEYQRLMALLRDSSNHPVYMQKRGEKR